MFNYLRSYRIADMKVWRQLQAIQTSGGGECALAIGNFDGCHLGHRALLQQNRQAAIAGGLRCAVLTFEPHPLAVLRPGVQVRRLGGVRDKIVQLASCGVDLLYPVRFNKQLAATSASAFCHILFADLRAKVVMVGENFRFGKGRLGDVELLRRIAKTFGAQVQTAPLLQVGGAVVSSGRIRAAIEDGNFDQAEVLLGRQWQMGGRVVRGAGLGAALGFATANLHLSFVPPCRGIFAGWVYDELDCRFRQMAAVSIGVNPTILADGKLSVEAHLLGFDGDLYGRRLVVRLCRKLRDEKQYADNAALQSAIGEDVCAVRRILGG